MSVKKILLVLILLLCATTVYAANPAMAKDNAAHYQILTILPPLVAIALAFITKNVIISLFFGTFTGCFLLELRTGNAFSAFTGGFIRVSAEALQSLSSPWNAGIILQVLTIGSLIALITRMGGVRAIAELVSKIAKSAKSSQFATWLMGLCIFFDDYANSLTVGPMMRPVTDKMRISREKFAFIVDATAAPISGMALISTWVAYEVGVINDAVQSIGVNYNAYGLFVSSLPYRFYNILIFVLILGTIYFLREFGPMHKAEVRARTTGEVLRAGSNVAVTDTMSPMPMQKESKSSVWYAIIPIGVLILGAFMGFYLNGYNSIMSGDDQELIAQMQNFSFKSVQNAFSNSNASVVLFQAALVASVTAIIMGLVKKLFTISEALETFLTGIKSMNITALILILAWSLSGTVKELGTAVYIVEHLSSSLPVWVLPAAVFILGSIISFATGTSYGTMGILMPLAIPLAWAINPNHDYLILNVGAVLTGAIFGDHCSPISDTTILSSMGAACDLMDHVRTQILYAIVVGVVAVLAYIMAALNINVWITLAVGTVLILAIVRFVGKPVPEYKE